MKSILFAAGIILALTGCATTPQHTAWSKPGVTKVDYGTDTGMCTGIAAIKASGGEGSPDGKAATQSRAAGGVASASTGSSAGTANAGGSMPTGGTYSGMASSDYAQRAAAQQRSAEMTQRRIQTDAYKSCLTERGYQEFTLTPEQNAKLATFKAGSNEYHEYLYSLATAAKADSAK
jgi:hypothetical protein